MQNIMCVGVRLRKDLHDWTESEAKRLGRSVSWVLNQMICDRKARSELLSDPMTRPGKTKEATEPGREAQ